MNTPDEKQCLDIMKQHNMLAHIIRHSVMVKEVADLILRYALQPFPILNPDLVNAAALLHDITKTRSFTTGEKHSETGCRLLEKMGYPETGDIVRQHVILDTYDRTTPVSEAEIVNYSDKRVLHDRVVHLNERLAYIHENYVTDEQHEKNFNKMWENTRMLEKKIFQPLAIKPEDIQQLNGRHHENKKNN